jgi:hypothetical protein
MESESHAEIFSDCSVSQIESFASPGLNKSDKTPKHFAYSQLLQSVVDCRSQSDGYAFVTVSHFDPISPACLTSATNDTCPNLMSAKARDSIQQFERIQVISVQLMNSSPDFPIGHMGEKREPECPR